MTINYAWVDLLSEMTTTGGNFKTEDDCLDDLRENHDRDDPIVLEIEDDQVVNVYRPDLEEGDANDNEECEECGREAGYHLPTCSMYEVNDHHEDDEAEEDWIEGIDIDNE